MIESPCCNVCSIDPHRQVCTGCFRTLTEISAWRDMTEVQRQQVLDLLEQRHDKYFGS